MGLGDLAFLSAGGCFRQSSDFGAASGFDTFGRSGAGGVFGLAKGSTHRGVGVFCLMGAGCQRCSSCCKVCSNRRSFGFSLSQKRLLPNLLRCAMP